ncbi:hypothetical protein [Bifidobacterium sp. ESL0704]|uniref:hypothetical protein n=1 Tax=Bifidobacterium sp. ESL0704 TaxID=2983219 RepID=UPI0023F99EC2|nr:hypothetical protein [Bifidobacterium sp. ESL0704]WEV53110.1 hypothetical protein OZX64_00995 [Bifidobacterium sp. ESL0704]
MAEDHGENGDNRENGTYEGHDENGGLTDERSSNHRSVGGKPANGGRALTDNPVNGTSVNGGASERPSHGKSVSDQAAASRIADSTLLSADQRAAVSGLAKENVYVGQSKWTTFRQLPAGQKGTFFVQHFLLGTIAVIVALVVVISLVVTYLTKPPTPVFTLQAVNMRQYSRQIGALQDGFVKYDNLKDARLADFGSDLTLGKNSYTDDSPKIMTQISAGQLNGIVTDKKTMMTLNKRGLVNKPAEVLAASELKRYLGMGVLVDAHGAPATNAQSAIGFDLSRSQVWKAKGLPDHTFFGFCNVQSGKDHPRAFVRYLQFK